MLNYMRRHASSTTIKILFWIIIAVFVLWGVGSFTSSSASYAAQVNGVTISPQELRRAAQNLERFYRNLYGQGFTPELVKALDVKNRALDQMINGLLMRQEAERLGLSVSEDEVRDAIQKIQGLMEGGRFQREVYFRFLRYQGITPAEFEAQQRDALLVKKMQSLIESSIRPDEQTAREVWVFSNEKVNLAFIRVKGSDLAKEITVDDAAVAKHFEDHREDFREPDRLAIEYLAYDEKEFEKSITVSDEDVQAEYDAHKADRYTEPEEVHARHILLQVPADADDAKRAEVRSRAEAVLERLKKAEDFAAVAKEVSDDKSNKEKGGDLGFLPRGRTEVPFEEAAFGLQPGELSGVVETRFGLHVIKVEERKAQREKPFEEAKDAIAESLKAERAREAARNAAFDDSQQALAGKSLADLGKARSLEVQTPPPFAENEPVTGLSRAPELNKAALETPVGQVGPVTTAGTTLVLFRTQSRVASHVPELAEITAKVEQAVRDRRGVELAKEKAEAIHKALLEKKPIAEVAEAEKLTVEETGPFTRPGEYLPRLGVVPDLKKEAFTLTAEKPVASGVYNAGGDAVVAVLKEHSAADPAEFDTQKDEILKRALEEQREAAIESLLNQLKRQASIRVNAQNIAGA